MRLTVSKCLARLTDCAISTFLGGSSYGQSLPDSWRVASGFMALCAAKRRSREWGVTVRREGRTLDGACSELVEKGRVSSEWVESAASR